MTGDRVAFKYITGHARWSTILLRGTRMPSTVVNLREGWHYCVTLRDRDRDRAKHHGHGHQ